MALVIGLASVAVLAVRASQQATAGYTSVTSRSPDS